MRNHYEFNPSMNQVPYINSCTYLYPLRVPDEVYGLRTPQRTPISRFEKHKRLRNRKYNKRRDQKKQNKNKYIS